MNWTFNNDWILITICLVNQFVLIRQHYGKMVKGMGDAMELISPLVTKVVVVIDDVAVWWMQIISWNICKPSLFSSHPPG